MFSKLLAIARKDIFTTFQDRQAILIMFAAPLALSLIIGGAFGSGGDVSIDAVPLAVINQDEPVSLGNGTAVALGQTISDAFMPPDDSGGAEDNPDSPYRMITELTDAELYADRDTATQKVKDGDLAALVWVGPDFSADAFGGETPGTIEMIYDAGRSIGPSVVSSILRGIANGMNTVILAQRTGPTAVANLGAEIGADDDAITRASGRMVAESMALAQVQPVQLEAVDLQGDTRSFDVLQYIAPAMAILFMTLGMASGATSILREQQSWTLQRIITTPTPRWVFMGGKLAGTYVTGVIQMVILIISTSLLGTMMGRENPVWGTNYAGIALVVLAVVFAGTALGLLIAAVSRTLDQANSTSTAAMFVLGMLGGSFFETADTLPPILPKLTLNYWGIQGFFDLSTNDAALGDIVPNLLALLALGAAFGAISLWRFNRRLDI